MPGDVPITPPRNFWGGSPRREKRPSSEYHPVRHAYISIGTLIAILSGLAIATQYIVSSIDRSLSVVDERVDRGIEKKAPAIIHAAIKVHEEKDIDISHPQIKPRLDEIRDDVREIKQIVQRRLGR